MPLGPRWNRSIIGGPGPPFIEHPVLEVLRSFDVPVIDCAMSNVAGIQAVAPSDRAQSEWPTAFGLTVPGR